MNALKKPAKKFCPNCGQHKDLMEFGKNKYTKDGLRSYCKSCHLIHVNSYHKTKAGLVSQIFRHQRSSSKKRNHPLPLYSLEDLRQWCFAQPLFHQLYNAWVTSGYSKMLRPSCDRLDDYQGYALDLLQIMTWQENSDKGNADRKNGLNNKDSKTVIQMTLTGKLVRKFYSVTSAARETGFNRGNISGCCCGNRETAGGYRWNFAGDI